MTLGVLPASTDFNVVGFLDNCDVEFKSGQENRFIPIPIIKAILLELGS